MMIQPKIILTHLRADFDAIASLLAAYKLFPDHTPIVPKTQNRNVREFLALYLRGLPLVTRDDLGGVPLEEVLLVDTQRVPDVKGLQKSTPYRVIDHHPLQPNLPPHSIVESTGANTTLLVEMMRAQGIRLSSSLEATLLMLGIYEDTGSLTYGTTTPRDIHAAAWLLEQHAVLDTVRRFLTPPLTPEQQTLFDALLRTAETRTIQGYPVTVAALQHEAAVSELAMIAYRLRETLEPAALFMVVEMPEYAQLICRATDDAIDVSAVARAFDGGGHSRAAAAAVTDGTLEAIVPRVWELVIAQIRPAATVGDLMSFGVQTVRPDEVIGTIISRLRRVGHEGYPVVDAGRVVGLLQLRDADRAIEHRLHNIAVREVMKSGEVVLTPNDSIFTLEQCIVDSGWGQIPITQDGQLIGIVTRTDLIKHWARTHPPVAAPPPTVVSAEQIQGVLGVAAGVVIQAVAEVAQQKRLTLYMVGGVVRDLLLNRHNDDIDFVVETDAIPFARAIQAQYGGDVHTHPAFGTAKWRLTGDVAEKLGVALDALPHHIDFATARNEFYEHPTALPTVYAGSIKLDLQRRDFTINTLAVQLSPAAGRVLDFYNGLGDLENGVVRVLHSLSFVDDPTRILRAVRFAVRLGFTIEPRTADLIATAREMLRRITGERVRNELNLLLQESMPAQGLQALESRGILQAIHPALTFTAQNAADFAALAVATLPEGIASPDLTALYWHVWLCRQPEAKAIGERLLFGRTESDSIAQAAALLSEAGAGWLHPDAKPSAIAAQLEGVPEVALAAVWVVMPASRERLETYLTHWRHIRPLTTGHTLKQMGLPPGPKYRQILERLRAARLDGAVTTDAAEAELLAALIAE